MTIGNFDAVHVGHQAIVKKLVAQGKSRGLATVLMTFLPGPDKYFRGESSAPQINNIAARYLHLKHLGLDNLLVTPFNRAMATLTAGEFVKDIVVDKLHTKYVLIGDDFKFGAARAGDYRFLNAISKQFDFEVARVSTIVDDGERISSSRVRHCLKEGNLTEATRLLGRPFSVIGRVIHGARRGRTWGFPTINLPLRNPPPLNGVFAVQVTVDIAGMDNHPIQGVANLGVRPSIGGMQRLLEVHLFDFNESIYGVRVSVEFLEKIRDEQKFESFDALKSQIAKDCETAKSCLMTRRCRLIKTKRGAGERATMRSDQ